MLITNAVASQNYTAEQIAFAKSVADQYDEDVTLTIVYADFHEEMDALGTPVDHS